MLLASAIALSASISPAQIGAITTIQIAALNTAQQMNGTPNKEALKLLPAELRDNPQVNPPADVMAKLQIFQDLGKGLKQYDRVWTRVRTAN